MPTPSTMHSTIRFCFSLLVTISIFFSTVYSFTPTRTTFCGRAHAWFATPSQQNHHYSQFFPMSDSNKASFELRSSKETQEPEMEASSCSSESLLTKIGSTTSAVVAGTFYLVLAWKRDALMVSFFIGSISNGILSKILKKVLKQERPADLVVSSKDLRPSDNGMPSSHAMSLGFIGTFTALQLPWTTLPILLYVTVSLVYRVKTNLHTVEQILVGVTVGSFNGYLWRSLCLGNNPFGINVMDWVSLHFLDNQGLLPWYALTLPAVVGAAVVGSVERRISLFLDKRFQKVD